MGTLVGTDCVHRLFTLFRFDNLLARYPGITSVRAGVCFVVDSHILLVRERSGLSYIGPPKGLAEYEDKSALVTALRELGEETGVKLNLNKLSSHEYKLLPETFCCHNERRKELSVYFVIVASRRPVIKIDCGEIKSYHWCDMSIGLKKKLKECSEPTKLLFTQLDDTIVYKRWQNVFRDRR